MFLLEIGSIAGLGRVSAEFIRSRSKPKEQTPFEQEAASLGDLNHDQAVKTLELFAEDIFLLPRFLKQDQLLFWEYFRAR